MDLQNQGPNPNQPPDGPVNPQPIIPPEPITPTPSTPPSPDLNVPPPTPHPQVVVSDQFSPPHIATTTPPSLPDTSNLFQPDVSTAMAGQPGRSSRKPLIAALIVLLLVVVGVTVLAIVATGKNPNSTKKAASTSTSVAKTDSKDVKVPADWQTLDTGLGFTVKAPPTWSLGISAESDFNSLKSKNVSISASSDTQETSSDAPSSPTETQDQVTVSTQQRTDQKSQKDFEEKVTKLSDSDAALLEGFGVKKEDIKISSRKLKINDKQWLEVTSDIPGQLSRTLYLWQKDHAIAIMVIGDSQQKLTSLTDSYLYPMTASVIVK